MDDFTLVQFSSSHFAGKESKRPLLIGIILERVPLKNLMKIIKF